MTRRGHGGSTPGLRGVVASSPCRVSCSVRPGAVLLEVLLSVALFVMGAALLGAAVQAGLARNKTLAQRCRATALAQSLLAEIRSGYRAVNDDRTEGDFLPAFPDYRFVVVCRAADDVPNLRYVTVTVSWDGGDGLAAPDGPSPASVQLTGWLCQQSPEQVEAEAADQAAQATGGASGDSGGGSGG